MRRRGRPGLVGTMARTAVIAGTATATAGAVHGHQQKKAAASQQQAALESQSQMAELQAQQAPAAVPAAGGTDLAGELQKLADLKAAGILDDAEFAAAKAKLLAG